MALAILVNIGFLRDPLSSRLADAVVPVMLLIAWMIGRALRFPVRRRQLLTVAAAAVLMAVCTRAVFAVGQTFEQLDRTSLRGRAIGDIPMVVRDQTRELVAPRRSLRQVPDTRLRALFPFFDYLDRCTSADDRLLVAGYAPEIFVYAGRMFAGGQKVFLPGYYDSLADQRRTVQRLSHERVPFVILLSDQLPE